MKKKLVARIKGGLGNQLFCYAAARRLAYINDAELILDNVSGFVRDKAFHRTYQLGGFSIQARIATHRERGEPLERIRRGISKLISRYRKFDLRGYIEDRSQRYEPKLLSLRLRNSLTTIDGLWQSYYYFADIEKLLRQELQINIQPSKRNLDAHEWIKKNNAIAVHVRWFSLNDDKLNVPKVYYEKALSLLAKKIDNPFFAVFSDNPGASLEMLKIPSERVLLVDWNSDDGGELADLWLMSNCRHFVMANSTFSWWGCWLGDAGDMKRYIYFPRAIKSKKMPWTLGWDHEGQMPIRWTPIYV